MNLPEIAVKRPIATVMLFAAVVVLGLVSFTRLPIQFLPDISPPAMGSFLFYRRPLGTEEMERRIMIPIESMIAQLPGVKRIYGNGSTNRCFFFIEFNFGTNVRYRSVELQEELDRFRRTFPRGSIDCRVFPFDSSRENRQAMQIALTGPNSDPYLEIINVDRVGERLNEIDGVSQVDIWGGREKIIEVAVEQDRMQEFNSPLFQILSRVRTYTAEPVFLGKVFDRGVAHYVRMSGQFRTAHELEDVIIRQEGNLKLDQLSQVREMRLNRRWISRVDGNPAVNIEIQKDSLTNPIALSKRVRQSFERIKQDLPHGYDFSVIRDSAELILEAIRGLSKVAAVGIALSLLMIFLFVHDVKVTAILALVIPISIIATFNLMYFGDLTINIVTLVGLAVGIGSLVDNGIVVLENITRHYERGVPPQQAAIRGTSEVGRAIFGLTITNVAVFLPIIFIEDWIRIIFEEGALAVIFPMVVSALAAILLVPMLASKVLSQRQHKRKSRVRDIFRRIPGVSVIGEGLRRVPRPNMVSTRRFYGNLLKSCLRHRVRLAIGIFLLLLYTYYYSMGGIAMGTMRDPEEAEGFEVFIFPPRGTKQSYTINVCAKVEALLKEHVPENKHLRTWVSDDDAHIHVELVDRSERKRDVPQIKEELRTYFEQIPDADVTFDWWRRRRESEMVSPVISTGGGVIEVRGPEQAQLERVVDEVMALIQEVPGIRDVSSDLESGALEMHFKPDREKASLLQVTPQSIAQHLQAAQRRGDFSTIRLKREEEEIDILFQQITQERQAPVAEEEREGLTLSEMRDLPIFAPSLRTTVPLSDLGVFEQVRGAQWIQRDNQSRIINIRYGYTPSAKQREVDEILKDITENYPVPAGFSMQLGGSSQEWQNMLSSVKMVIWIAVLLVYMILAGILESFATPLVIMVSEPLALLGIVWALLLTKTPFDELAGFGAIFLIGVLPNSPLILLHIVQVMRRERSFTRERAMMIAGYSRLRPILMTVGTTVLGILPMAFKTTDNATWVPFARVTIGGLLSSTVLTLFIIPGVYFGLEDLKRLVGRGIRWIISWRWIFVFWSDRKRSELRNRLTEYHRKPEREEPLVIVTKNLTRIYAPPVLDRIKGYFHRMVWWGPAGSPVLGLLPGERPRLGFTPDWDRERIQARKKALAGIELEIRAGMFGLLGPNGAGKTTFLRLLAGIDQPTRGYISMLGYDFARELKHARKQIGYLPQEFGVYGSLTAYQYLDYMSLLKGMKEKRERREAIDRALDMVNLTHVREVPVGNFSGGMIRRIGLAQIFLKPPKVLIVDEPTAGLDPLERIRFRNLLTSLAVNRVVILSTHIVEDVAHSCPRLAILQEGRITFAGETEDLVRTAEGCVWELLTRDTDLWKALHAGHRVVAQIQTPQGIRMRIVSKTSPHPQARILPPTLEDAYILHIAEKQNHSEVAVGK